MHETADERTVNLHEMTDIDSTALIAVLPNWCFVVSSFFVRKEALLGLSATP